MRIRSQLWCWVALWAFLVGLAVAVLLLHQRIERYERSIRPPRDEKVRDHAVPGG